MTYTSFFRALALLFTIAVLSEQAYADAVWIDVRSVPEHLLDSIEGDTLIPHSEIVTEVSSLYPDKATEIKLYCRSGGRAGVAMAALREAGYENVSNIGGIGDARKTRGLVE